MPGPVAMVRNVRLTEEFADMAMVRDSGHD